MLKGFQNGHIWFPPKNKEIAYKNQSICKSGDKNPMWKGGKIKKNCLNCNKEFITYKGIYCSKICQLKCPIKIQKIREANYLKRGKKSSNWKGGITTLSHLIRNNDNHKEWIKKVLKRDNYICQKCFNVRRNLHCHHIYYFSFILRDFLKEYSQFSPIEDKEILNRISFSYYKFWDLDNGITLCKKCHIKEHNKDGKVDFYKIRTQI